MSATVILVGCLKGGVGKTKTSMFVGQDLADRGHEVLIVDADPGTQGVAGWVQTLIRDHKGYELPWQVRQWARECGLLGMWVPQQAADCEADYVVLDVGAEIPDVLQYAAMLADHVVIPIGTHQDELDRLSATLTAIQGGARPGVVPRVLLTRVDAIGVGAARAVREALDSSGVTVCRTEIARNKGLYDRYGQPIDGTGHYHDLVSELLA